MASSEKNLSNILVAKSKNVGKLKIGIVVSDSRPVKIPRDSKPIPIPKPTSGQERRPFLIDPQAIADELPFTPVTAPFTETVEASPSVLSIDVENEAAGQSEEGVQMILGRVEHPHARCVLNGCL